MFVFNEFMEMFVFLDVEVSFVVVFDICFGFVVICLCVLLVKSLR